MRQNGNKVANMVLFGVFLCNQRMTLGHTNTPIRNGNQGPSTSPNNGPTVANPVYGARVLKWKHLTDAARKAMREDDYVAAEDFARQALNQRVGQDLSLKLLVGALHAQGEDMEALPFYQKISEEGETSPGCELPYALLLLKTGQWGQAVTVYNRTLPYLSEGELLRAHSDFSPNMPRKKDLETAIHIGIGIQDIGWCDWGGKLHDDEGLSNLRQAIALAPSSALAHYQYGVGLTRTSHTSLGKAQAQTAFKKAAALDSGGEIKAAAEKEISGR